jgi:hypothetical protein
MRSQCYGVCENRAPREANSLAVLDLQHREHRIHYQHVAGPPSAHTRIELSSFRPRPSRATLLVDIPTGCSGGPPSLAVALDFGLRDEARIPEATRASQARSHDSSPVSLLVSAL